MGHAALRLGQHLELVQDLGSGFRFHTLLFGAFGSPKNEVQTDLLRLQHEINHVDSQGTFIGSTGAVCSGGALISARTLQALDKGDQVDKPNSM